MPDDYVNRDATTTTLVGLAHAFSRNFSEAEDGLATEVVAVGLDGEPVTGVGVELTLVRMQWHGARRAEGGVSVMTWTWLLVISSRESNGRANAAVLPVPVGAWPSRSCPSSRYGTACAWIGVGVS